MAYKKLTLVKPCSENYGAMTPKGEGRHCNSCNTIIVDFSELNDTELIDVIKSGKYHCGRFSSEQVDRIYHIQEPFRQRKKYWMAIAASIVAGMFQVAPLNAQHTPIVVQNRTHIKGDKTLQNKSDEKKVETQKDKIEIQVLDSKGMFQLTGATITIKELNINSELVGDGLWSLEIAPDIDRKKTVTIVIEHTFYHKKTVRIKLDKILNLKKQIFLNGKPQKISKKHYMLGGWGLKDVEMDGKNG